MKRLSFLLAVFSLALVINCSKEDIEGDVVSTKHLKYYQSGTHDGYFWSLWISDGYKGTVNYKNGPGGNYDVQWSNFNGNFTCGKGWSRGATNRVIGYNIGICQINGGGVVGYYGWTRNPLIEYYVNERWGSSRPTGTKIGSVSSDGGTYDCYTAMRYNAPSIDGTQTFRQLFSTRTSMAPTGQNRQITFANHVNAWKRGGYSLGTDLSPAAIMLTEAYGSNCSGRVNLTVWKVSGN